MTSPHTLEQRPRSKETVMDRQHQHNVAWFNAQRTATLDPRRVLAHARIEALLDLVAGRLPNARHAFDACNANGPFLDESKFSMFEAEYKDASEKATRKVVGL